MSPFDKEDFANLYDREVWSVYGFIGYRLTSRADVEDLTQQTFEKALRAWEKFDPRRGEARVWLLAIARNLLIDHFRRNKSAAGASFDECDESPALTTEPSPEERLGIDPELEAALTELGQRERELIALRFGGDLNGPEIARLTGLSVANVHQILSRSLRRLRDELKREPGTKLGRERAGASQARSGDREHQSTRSGIGGNEPLNPRRGSVSALVDNATPQGSPKRGAGDRARGLQ
jgi:RNA polymerase sigma-70 factor, ECF subfamily